MSPSQTGRTFRDVMAHVPTSVSAVTAVVREKPIGLTVGSLFSVSLAPPLIGWCAAMSSRSWPLVREAGSFCVNVLARHQQGVCEQFASVGDDKYRGVTWTVGDNGAPRLRGAIAWLECDVECVHTAGDHEICLGRVTTFALGDTADPLLFYRRQYALPRLSDEQLSGTVV